MITKIRVLKYVPSNPWEIEKIKQQICREQKNKMVSLCSNISVIIGNINDLNITIKIGRVRTSLVLQWLRIHLPVQEKQV